MAAQRAYPGSLHAANAAANDYNVLFGFRGGNGILLLPGHRRIQSTAQILTLENAVQASRVAGDAGANLLCLFLHQLVGPFRVRQKLPGQTDAIDLFFLNGLEGQLRVFHPTGANHRDMHMLFDLNRLGQIAPLRHVHRRMSVPPGIVGAIVGVEHVVAAGFQQLRRSNAFIQIAAHLGKRFPWQRTAVEALHHGAHAVPDGNRVVLTAAFLDGLHNLLRKQEAAFQAAAVFVGPLVAERQRELIQQIALVHRMDLHTVHAAFLRLACGLVEAADILLDLLRVSARWVMDGFQKLGSPSLGATGSPSAMKRGCTRPAPEDSCIKIFAP